ncbi:skin secretory protein xP2-like [Sarcophilus harrisii]|uniref:skin secretory protein xP2-like n=1 Tax=Sarcophilus harrisii TaxID=9305 RepID=UPI001301C91F|nr:skin secretory protein xP2-like [Sarcophilus harrisii]
MGGGGQAASAPTLASPTFQPRAVEPGRDPESGCRRVMPTKAAPKRPHCPPAPAPPAHQGGLPGLGLKPPEEKEGCWVEERLSRPVPGDLGESRPLPTAAEGSATVRVLSQGGRESEAQALGKAPLLPPTLSRAPRSCSPPQHNPSEGLKQLGPQIVKRILQPGEGEGRAGGEPMQRRRPQGGGQARARAHSARTSSSPTSESHGGGRCAVFGVVPIILCVPQEKPLSPPFAESAGAALGRSLAPRLPGEGPPPPQFWSTLRVPSAKVSMPRLQQAAPEPLGSLPTAAGEAGASRRLRA